MADVDLTMRSDVVVVNKILKKTRARVFENFEVGDRIQLSVEAESVGGSRGRSYAADIRVSNLTKGEHTFKTFNTLDPLYNFEFTKEAE